MRACRRVGVSAFDELFTIENTGPAIRPRICPSYLTQVLSLGAMVSRFLQLVSASAGLVMIQPIADQGAEAGIQKSLGNSRSFASIRG